MKKLFLLMALAGVIGLTSCGGNGNADSSDQSSIESATDAVQEGVDSLSATSEDAIDTLSAKVDSVEEA